MRAELSKIIESLIYLRDTLRREESPAPTSLPKLDYGGDEMPYELVAAINAAFADRIIAAPPAPKKPSPRPAEVAKESRRKRNEAIVADRKAGMKQNEIAQKHGVTQGCVSAVLRSASPGRASMTRVESRARDVLLLRDIRLGMSTKQAAEKYGVGANTIYNLKAKSAGKGKGNG